MKKLTSAFLAVIMVISLSCFGASAETYDKAETVTLDNYKEKIVEAVVENENITADNIEVISLDNGSAKSANPEMAIRIYDETGAMTLIPQVIVNDELVNSFAYTKKALMSKDYSFPVNLVDVTLKFNCYYEVAKIDNWLPVYIPKGLSFSWMSSNSSAHVNSIETMFDAKGDYWYIPSGNDLGYEKYVKFVVNKSNPSKGYWYNDSSQALSNSYGLVCSDYFSHGGNLYYETTYTVNGTTRNSYKSFPIFGK